MKLRLIIPIFLAAYINATEYKDSKEATTAVNNLFAKPFDLTTNNNGNIQSVFGKLSGYVLKAANKDKDLTEPVVLAATATQASLRTLNTISKDKYVTESSNIASIVKELDAANKLLNKATFYLPSKRDARTVLNLYISKLSKYLLDTSKNFSILAMAYKKLGVKEDSSVYAVLNLSTAATDAEVARAAKLLLAKLHPDRNPGDKVAEGAYKLVVSARDCIIEKKCTKNSQVSSLRN